MKLLSLIMTCKVFLSVSTYGFAYNDGMKSVFTEKLKRVRCGNRTRYALQRTALKMMCIFSTEMLKRCVAGSLITEIGLFEFRRRACVKK